MKHFLLSAALLGMNAALFPHSAPAAAFDNEDDLLSIYFTEEELVESATRAPKPMSQVAENVSIIDAARIEAMNAHSLAEVLNRVVGLDVGFNGNDFNSSASLHIQESDYEHVLVLLDGLRWNDDASGMAVTNAIPMEIVDRIEVIKGPASSTWGSSLGGVVNIITRGTGNSRQPSGRVSASYGEADSQEYNATVSGKFARTGYFLAVGSQSSNGLMANRFYDRENIYGKVSLDLPRATTLTLSSGYSEPELRYFDHYGWGLRAEGIDRNFWSSATLDSRLNRDINLNVNLFRKEQKYIRPNYTLPDKNFWYETYNDNWSQGISAILHANFSLHSLVLGAEFERAESETETGVQKHDEVWSLYGNDTLRLGAFTLTPGLRFDHLALTADMVSPSLGLTWQMTGSTLLRALAARGFRRPYMASISPGLDPETVDSYQLGLESAALSFATVKATIFEHRLKDTWIWDWDACQYANGPRAKRYGYELEMTTLPAHHLTLAAGFSYTYSDHDDGRDNDDQYSAKFTLTYDDPQVLHAELFGNYTWWNKNNITSDGDNGALICDLNLAREFRLGEQRALALFATAHNLFDGRHYWHPVFENPHRWVEAGVRFYF